MTKKQRYKKIVRKINQLEKKYQSFKNEDFIAQKDLFKMRLKSGVSLEEIMPEAFALVREAAKRILGLRAFDVQILGAIAAHYGDIVEMKTGEGKTLAIIFPAFLNALSGKGVHIVTANDYLAKRDAQWMGKVYRLLGLSVDFINSQTNNFERQVAYGSDLTYVTSREVCFDFLKDNMIYELKEKRHRGFNYVIIDEADSVLIDEAQVPLVISSANNDKKQFEKDKILFIELNKIISHLENKKDFTVNKKNHSVFLTNQGIKKLEKLINVKNLYEENTDYIYYIECLLKAHCLFKRDQDYIIDDKGKVVIVDEFTGRIMEKHRYHQGIHQAIEVKEEAKLNEESEVLALTTFQHFFKYYKKMTGFTGTAKTAEKELRTLYNKKVFVVPTNKPIRRKDLPDKFFLKWKDKINYLTWSTQEYFFKEGAVLVGTRSVKKSIEIQKNLAEENIPSNVLNAKHTFREAEVISQAGQPQTVTVATNMAGRGTDIKLNKAVKEKEGLMVFGMERHNSRRIDNQLIGRSGRQGDPGKSQFLISADDSLIDIYFRKEYIKKIKKLKNYKKGTISKKMEKILKKAQKRMESIYFDQRFLNYEFDKVLEKQRKGFYAQRQQVLYNKNLKKFLISLINKEFILDLNRKYKLKNQTSVDKRTLEEIKNTIHQKVNNGWFALNLEKKYNYDIIEIKEKIRSAVERYYQDFENFYSSSKMRQIEKTVILKVMDLLWVEHIKRVDELQDIALIKAIKNDDFFENYELEMEKLYYKTLSAISPAIVSTFFRVINKLWNK